MVLVQATCTAQHGLSTLSNH